LADVFISYAREDRDFAALLAKAMEGRGLALWWDRDVLVGQSFSAVIEKELDGAYCVVVLWSSASIESDWVLNEAAEGARRKILVPVLIQDVRPPLEFRRLQTARLFDANAIEGPEFEACISAIRGRLQSSQPGIVDAPSKPRVPQSVKATAPASQTPAKAPATLLPPLPRRFRYHVLFSYASADQEYVHNVRTALPAEVKVFEYAMDDFVIWGNDLAKELEHRDENEAPFCVVFISEAYLKGPWTNRELAIVQRVAKRRPGYMLPVLLDGTKVPELDRIAWLGNTLTPEQLAARIVAKIREPPPKPWWFYLSMEVKVASAIAAVVITLAIFAVRGCA
jgi:hypothetical protein